MSMNFATNVVMNNTYSLQAQILKAPSTSGSSTFGVGSNGQVLISNGTTIFWGTTNVDNLFSVSTGSASGEYWWTLTIPRTGLYNYNNAPGSNGRIRYLLIPTQTGSSFTQLELPTDNGKIALTSEIPQLEPMANVQAMLTELGLDANVSLSPAQAGTAETDHAIVQEG